MDKKIKEFLSSRLTHNEYQNLAKSLKITQTKLSRLLNQSDEWEACHVLAVSRMLNVQPSDLIRQCGLITNITIHELDKIENEYERYIRKSQN